MKGKNNSLLKFAALSLGVDSEVLLKKIELCNDRLSNYDRLQFMEIGIPCRNIDTKDALVNNISAIGISYMVVVKKNSFYLASRALNRFTRCVNKEFSRKTVEELL